MRRGLVALFALLEALFVVAIGIGIPLAVGVAGWASLAGAAFTPFDAWRLAVQVWALGHGAPLQIDLGDVSGIFASPNNVFALTIAPFGFAAVTAALGHRAGKRIAVAQDAPLVAGLFVVFVAVLSGAALASALSATVTFDVPLAAIRIVTIFVIGLLLGWRPWDSINGTPVVSLPDWGAWKGVITDSIRIARGNLLALIGLASVSIAVAIVAGFPTEIALFESLHAGALGGVVVAALQFAVIPVLIVWAVAWFAGPGFALGSGSIVSPLATTVGAAPAIPVLGAIPENLVPGWWVMMIPVVVSALVTAGALRPSALVEPNWGVGWFFARAGLVSLAAATLVALSVLVVGSLASGSAGPGRFAEVGIDPLVVALTLGGEVLVGTLVAAFTRVAFAGSR